MKVVSIALLLLAALLLIPLTPLGSWWYQVVIVKSASMEPAIPVGSVVVYRAVNDYQAGDVVVYQRQERLIIHRVTATFDGGVVTQGDATDSQLEPVFHQAMKGKVMGVVPLVGYWLAWVQSPTGIALTIGLPLVVLLVLQCLG